MFSRIVESRKGAVARGLANRPVSLPRSSNRTCGFPASGFPTVFIVRPAAVIQRQDAEFSKDHVTGKTSRATVWDLVSSCEETSYAAADMMIDGLVGIGERSMAEVCGPASQEPVQLVPHRGPWLHVAGRQHVIDLQLDAHDAFLGWACAEIKVAVPFVAVRSERVSEKVEALRSSVLQRGFRLVERQPELRHHAPRPRQSLGGRSTAEDDEVVGVVDDMRAEGFASAAAPPVLQEAVHIDVGE